LKKQKERKRDVAQETQGAEAVWDYLRTTRGAPKPDTVMYTAMMHACGKAGQAERALALLEEMQGEGLVPTEVTYNVALFATARRRDMWKEGKALFEAMQRAGMEPTE
jgi:pentatricopeptide repeat protein